MEFTATRPAMKTAELVSHLREHGNKPVLIELEGERYMIGVIADLVGQTPVDTIMETPGNYPLTASALVKVLVAQDQEGDSQIYHKYDDESYAYNDIAGVALDGDLVIIEAGDFRCGG